MIGLKADPCSTPLAGEVDQRGTFAATTQILLATGNVRPKPRESYVVNAEGETQSFQQNFVAHGIERAREVM